VERKGKLYARLQYRSETGEYKTKYRPITDKRVARSVVEEMRRELEVRGEEGFDAKKMTFNELADQYEKVELVEAVFRNGIKVIGKRSLDPTRSALKPLRFYFGSRPVAKIRASDLKAFKNERINTPVEKQFSVRNKMKNPATGRMKWFVTKETRSTPRKMASVNRELALLRAVLEFAFANEWLVVNPFQRARGIVSRAAEVERDRILSFEEEERLLAACVESRAHLRPILICALDTAMRRGEIFKMKWADVSFETGEIVIPATNTKTERSRIVAVTKRLHTELTELWMSSPKDLSMRVFGLTNNIKHAWSTACRIADVSDFRLHDCRHTATTRMIASGSAHTEVMKITGHSQMKTFLRYLTITQSTAGRVASQLDDYLLRHAPADDATEYVQ
jgi:integrase